MKKNILLTWLVTCLFQPLGLAENWPQWRGPMRNGISGEQNLPLRWSTTENVAWKTSLPSHSGSTPIIWKDQIFLSVAEGDSLHLWCLDRKSGEVLWKRYLGGGNIKTRKQNMTSPSAVTDGQRVYVVTGTGVLKGFDRQGKELWKRDLQADYGLFGLNFGYASSPLLLNGDLYLQVLHGMKTDDPSYVLRVDGAAGRTDWKVERPTEAVHESPDSYTTPAVWRSQDRVEVIVSGGDCVTGHDPETGRELWRADGLNPNRSSSYRIVASPVVFEDLIFVPTRVRPLLVLRPGGRGDVSQSHRVWSFDHGPDVPTPVTDGRFFYIVNDRGVVWCLQARTGTPVWGPERIASGPYSSSPVLADGKIYITNEDGLTSVMRAGPRFELLASNPLEEYCLSSPAVTQGQIFIRTERHLYCIGKPNGR